MSNRTRRPVFVALTAIFTTGLALRLLGVGYGLPAVFNPDEVAIMNRALGFARGDLNPGNFVYPTFYFYVLFAWEGLFFLAGHLLGLFDSLGAFERSFFVDPSLIYLAGRILTTLLGALTLLATWRLGARLFGQAAGLIAALLLAVAPLAVIDAHYVKHDVPVALLVVLTHLALADLLDSRRRQQSWRWVAAGAIAGLAMSTHYYAVLLVLPLTLAALLPVQAGETLSTRLRWLILTGVASIATFFAGSPFLLVEPASAVRDMIANREIVFDRVTSATGIFGSLGFYVSWLARGAAGTFTSIAAAAGILLAVLAGWRTALLLLSFPVGFLLFISNTFPATRYLNPILPFVAVLAGASLAWLGRQRGLAGRLAMGAIVIAATAEAGQASLQADLFFRQEDTRTQAKRWIEREVPPGTSVLVQPYSVVLRRSRGSLVEALEANLGSVSRASIKFQRMLALDPYPEPSYRLLYLGVGGLDADKIYVPPVAFAESGGLGPLRALAIDYVVLKRFEAPDPSLVALERALEQEAHRVATFSPYWPGVAATTSGRVRPFIHNADVRIDPALERPGPIIEVWKIQ